MLTIEAKYSAINMTLAYLFQVSKSLENTLALDRTVRLVVFVKRCARRYLAHQGHLLLWVGRRHRAAISGCAARVDRVLKLIFATFSTLCRLCDVLPIISVVSLFGNPYSTAHE